MKDLIINMAMIVDFFMTEAIVMAKMGLIASQSKSFIAVYVILTTLLVIYVLKETLKD